MEDATKYIAPIKLHLIKIGRGDIAQLLDGASGLLDERSDWMSFTSWSLMTIYLHPQYFLKFSPDMEKYINDVLPIAIPRNARLDSIRAEYSVNAEGNFNTNDNVTNLTNGFLYQPIFGNPSTDDKYKCDIFVIMPFKEDLKSVYDDIIKPVVENMGYTIKRADDLYTDKESMHKIWSMFHACQLVIADCTGHNPNVFYELGIAHTLGKPTIIVTQNIDGLPFDIRNKDALSYSLAFHQKDKFEQTLKKAIQDMIGYKPIIGEIPF